MIFNRINLLRRKNCSVSVTVDGAIQNLTELLLKSNDAARKIALLLFFVWLTLVVP